jgi:MFS superfamily sulfate permease-like transporter
LGVIVAIAVSLVQLIFKSAKPNFARLGRLPGTLVYKDIKRFAYSLIPPRDSLSLSLSIIRERRQCSHVCVCPS